MKGARAMATQLDTVKREIVLIEEAHIRLMMGLDIVEPLKSARIPYSMVDPYILVHEALIPITPERVSLETNLWYAIPGFLEHGPQHRSRRRDGVGEAGGRIVAEVANGSRRLARGKYRPGRTRGGQGGTQMRGLLFCVNLARKDKGAEPSAQLLQAREVPVRHDGDAIVRVLLGEGSPVELGTRGLILDVELPTGGGFASLAPPGMNGFVYMLEGRASIGASRRWVRRSEIAVLGREAVRRDAYLERTVRRLMPPLYPGPVASWLSCSGTPQGSPTAISPQRRTNNDHDPVI
jgi:hypothetical protein